MVSRPEQNGNSLIPGYRILSLLGRGGMGAVYRAVKENIDKEVALKVLLPGHAGDPVTAARFDREVRALARIRHPGLVNVIDAGTHPPYRFLVMDLIGGEDLEARVDREGPMEPGTVESIARQVLEALSCVHERGMVHRDLKPANLILDPEGRVHLCDLGLVRIVDEDSRLTQKLLIGTPEYVSPEQVRGETELDIRSDLYSLGATLFFLLAGRPPFRGETPMATAQCHLGGGLPRLSGLRPRIPRRLLALIRGLSEPRKERRFESPQAARAFLRDFDARLRRRRRGLFAASGLLGLVLLGALLPGFAREPAPALDFLRGEYELTLLEWRGLEEVLEGLSPGERALHAGAIASIRRRLEGLGRRLQGARE